MQLKLEPVIQSAAVEEKVAYNKIHVNQSTFKAGLAAKVHRWFRLTPSFGPDLVQEMLAALKCSEQETVLDPFAGASTTLIESQLEGRRCLGFEINPLLHFVGTTCLNWELEPKELQKALKKVAQGFDQLAGKVTLDNLDSYGLQIPPIHNPTRWWRPDVLAEMIVLKNAIHSINDEATRNFFRLCLAGVLVPDLTNVTLGRLQLHFINKDSHEINVWPTFERHAQTMINDLADIQSGGWDQSATLFLTDSTTLKGCKPKGPVHCVITSPPYPNRYSYVWNTRPHLYMLDFFENGKQASDLDKDTIGGTWGTATSILNKGIIAPEHEALKKHVLPVVEEIRLQDNLMANYVMKYFNLLAKQIVRMDELLADNARVAYVVGCSRIKGIYVETDVLLGKLFEDLGLGYTVSTAERFRKRHSDKDLHESIVYAWKR